MTSIHGIDMHHEEHGSGPPLLLLHGFTGTSQDWKHVFDLDSLAREYRIIAPDLRGHGRSTNPSGKFSFRECAHDVYALLEHLGINYFRAIGVSLGAKTLLHMATQANRIDSMVLVSPAPYFPAETRTKMRQWANADHSAEEWTLMRSRHPQGDDAIRALWELPATFADRYDDMAFTPPQLSTITARTLIIYGDRDPLYPVELALEMYRAIRRSSLWIIPDGGHAPIFDGARETFARTALSFLNEPN